MALTAAALAAFDEQLITTSVKPLNRVAAEPSQSINTVLKQTPMSPTSTARQNARKTTTTASESPLRRSNVIYPAAVFRAMSPEKYRPSSASKHDCVAGDTAATRTATSSFSPAAAPSRTIAAHLRLGLDPVAEAVKQYSTMHPQSAAVAASPHRDGLPAAPAAPSGGLLALFRGLHSSVVTEGMKENKANVEQTSAAPTSTTKPSHHRRLYLDGTSTPSSPTTSSTARTSRLQSPTPTTKSPRRRVSMSRTKKDTTAPAAGGAALPSHAAPGGTSAPPSLWNPMGIALDDSTDAVILPPSSRTVHFADDLLKKAHSAIHHSTSHSPRSERSLLSSSAAAAPHVPSHRELTPQKSALRSPLTSATAIEWEEPPPPDSDDELLDTSKFSALSRRPPSPVVKALSDAAGAAAAESNGQSGGGDEVSARLSAPKSARYHETIRKLQQEQAEKLAAIYTFKPAIDKKSLAIAKQSKNRPQSPSAAQNGKQKRTVAATPTAATAAAAAAASAVPSFAKHASRGVLSASMSSKSVRRHPFHTDPELASDPGDSAMWDASFRDSATGLGNSMNLAGVDVVESVASSAPRHHNTRRVVSDSDAEGETAQATSSKQDEKDKKCPKRSVDDLLNWDKQRRAKQAEALAAKKQEEEEALEQALLLTKPKLNSHSRWLVHVAADRRISAVDHAVMSGAAHSAEVQRTRSPAARRNAPLASERTGNTSGYSARRSHGGDGRVDPPLSSSPAISSSLHHRGSDVSASSKPSQSHIQSWAMGAAAAESSLSENSQSFSAAANISMSYPTGLAEPSVAIAPPVVMKLDARRTQLVDWFMGAVHDDTAYIRNR